MTIIVTPDPDVWFYADNHVKTHKSRELFAYPETVMNPMAIPQEIAGFILAQDKPLVVTTVSEAPLELIWVRKYLAEVLPGNTTKAVRRIMSQVYKMFPQMSKTAVRNFWHKFIQQDVAVWYYTPDGRYKDISNIDLDSDDPDEASWGHTLDLAETTSRIVSACMNEIIV
ncbi:MAG: hypothetical protein WC551_08645 [Patescibacteria group bacterium]